MVYGNLLKNKNFGFGRVAQWIEQLPSKQSAAGSNPAALVLIQYSSSMLVTMSQRLWLISLN